MRRAIEDRALDVPLTIDEVGDRYGQVALFDRDRAKALIEEHRAVSGREVDIDVHRAVQRLPCRIGQLTGQVDGW